MNAARSPAQPYGPRLGPDDDGRRFLRVLDDPWLRLVVRLQDTVIRHTALHWEKHGVAGAMVPITTSSASSPMGLGSDSTPVEVDLAGVRTMLADSMQFSLEYLCRLHPKGAWYLMPSFRGEPSDATHLGQFFHSEVELAVDLAGAMAAADAYLHTVTEAIVDELAGPLNDLGVGTAHLSALVDEPAERISFDDAAAILIDVPGAVVSDPCGWRNLTRSGEQALLRHVGRPVWVSHWDHLAVPFYQAFDDAGRACNADLLLGLGEVVGLGQRHADGDGVRRALDLHQVAAEPYDWYVELHDVKPMVTAGFGMGVERYLAWVLGHHDIRDLQVLPRHHGLELVP